MASVAAASCIGGAALAFASLHAGRAAMLLEHCGGMLMLIGLVLLWAALPLCL